MSLEPFGQMPLRIARICANVPTSGLKRAQRFYEAVLGLEVERADEARGVYYRAGGGTMLNLYEREHELAGHAVATFLVEDIKRAMALLRDRGVSLKEYDEPISNQEWRVRR